MRRLIPLILALLLMSACGAEAPPTAEPTPTPTVEPTLEPLPESAPASLPDAGFEPESFWLAEPFGDGGKALLLMSGIRERLDTCRVPKALKGTPIALIMAGLMSLAFMAFRGMAA